MSEPLRARGYGSRRFRDLLRREREDVAMLGRHVSEMYDSITFGQISKPNTLPSEVIAVFEERLEKECAEAEAEAIQRIEDAAHRDKCNPSCLSFTAGDWKVVKRDILGSQP